MTLARDQGDCGSCWAFSSAAAIETATAVAKNATVAPAAHVSVQQLIDCVDRGDWLIPVKGCFGGWPPAALAYAKTAGGLAPEAAYPYRAVSGATCDVTRADAVGGAPAAEFVTLDLSGAARPGRPRTGAAPRTDARVD